MKGGKLDTPWRTVQVFISSQAAGIFEVEVNTDTKNTRCNCPVWKKTEACKHSKFVKDKMRFNDGHYSIQIPTAVAEEIALEASETSAAFRDFVIRYAKVEVI